MYVSQYDKKLSNLKQTIFVTSMTIIVSSHNIVSLGLNIYLVSQILITCFSPLNLKLFFLVLKFPEHGLFKNATLAQTLSNNIYVRSDTCN